VQPSGKWGSQHQNGHRHSTKTRWARPISHSAAESGSHFVRTGSATDGNEAKLILAQDGLVLQFRDGGRSVPVLAVLDLGPRVSGFIRQRAEVVQQMCFAAAVRM
jgi:hypothetical protein